MSDAKAGQELDRFRTYLALLARLQLDPHWQNKVDLSGVVQQTLLDAHQTWDKFQNWSEGQKLAWLRKALANNLTDEVRKLETAARDVGREQSLQNRLEESSARLESWLSEEQENPIDQLVKQEQLLQLAAALEQLPNEQRQAVELHHLAGFPVAEIAQQMSRSPGAIGALLVRGLKKLRKFLADNNGDEG